MTDVTIRLATEADVAAINAIYNHYVNTSTCTFQLTPESDAARLAWLTHPDRHAVYVAESATTNPTAAVVGWASLSRHSPREGYARTADSSIYIAPGHHRRGIGRALMAAVLDHARTRVPGLRVVVAGATADQAASIALHAALGFRQVARFEGVGEKFGRVLDVVYMQTEL
ncbi:hypothetical protein H9P43_001225 [Blastocladiella emersonii ATCC 22665]|nr:hypothetical protein H9P43_001225 [Blastocladiella emersonii ATCC 22665]